MRKTISSILMIVVILANLLAPVSVGWGKDGVKMEENKANAFSFGALDGTNDSGIMVEINPSVKDREIKFDVKVNWMANSLFTTTEFEIKRYLDDKGINVETKKPSMTPPFAKLQSGSVIFEDLDPSTTYKFDIYLFNESMDTIQTLVNIATFGIKQDTNNGYLKNEIPYEITTLPETPGGYTDFVEQKVENNVLQNEAMFLPICDIGHIGGCVGKIFYHLLFEPTSYIFALSGKLFDYIFAYSINDASYRSTFVVQGWNVVRDFCNMFFIFVLLYIAFGTILNLHGVKTKEMIINVVIIGLLINFSLFAARIIIDTSNILARVFYSSIIVGEKENGTLVEKKGTFEEKQISEAIVKKINPQTIILNAGEASLISKKGVNIKNAEENKLVDSATFFLVTLLASAMNIIGIIVFLSAALIFIARVAGLWIAMILVPFAFFSYTVPAMKDLEMVGWKKWWPETIKLAFLAPVFIFFIYLIVQFLETGLGVIDASNKHGIDFFIATLVPFGLLMTLMWKAKDIAKKMSGAMGQSITNGVAAAGGLVLGGAALGTALLGRKTIGSVAKYVQNDASRTKDAKKFGGYKDWSLGKKLNPFAYVGQTGKTIAANVARPIAAIGREKNAQGTITKKGYLQRAEQGFGHKTHATHLLDAKMQSEFGHQYGKDAKYNDLSEHEQAIVKKEIDKDEMAKHIYGKLFKDLEAPEAKLIQDQYNLGERAISDGHGGTSFVRAPRAGEVIKSDYITTMAKTNAAMGEFVQALRKGSYDIRNISKASFSSKGGVKMGVGLAAVIASGVRMGMKKGVGVEYGTGQKDFVKDIGNTITEALKGIKIDVKTGGGHDDGGHKEVKSVGH